MYAVSLVDFALEKHPDQNFSELKKETLFLIDDFGKQSEFQIAKNMVIVLHKLLTTPDKEEIERWGMEFKNDDFLLHLKNLHLLLEQVQNRVVMAEIHGLFSGRCIELAAEYVASVNQRSLRFTEQSGSGEQLLKAKKLPLEKYQKVSDFCSKYSVPKI